MTTDQDLVERFRETRDDDSFRQIVERHQQRVFHVALSVLGPAYAAEAEDVAQEVFLQAYLRIKEFRGAAALSSWLYRIAWNRAADRRRLARFRHPHGQESESGSHSHANTSHANGPLEDALQRERAGRVHAAVEKLPDVYRTVVRLHYWLGCPLAEIQEMTAIPVGTVKSYLARARKRLEKSLAHV